MIFLVRRLALSYYTLSGWHFVPPNQFACRYKHTWVRRRGHSQLCIAWWYFRLVIVLWVMVHSHWRFIPLPQFMCQHMHPSLDYTTFALVPHPIIFLSHRGTLSDVTPSQGRLSLPSCFECRYTHSSLDFRALALAPHQIILFRFGPISPNVISTFCLDLHVDTCPLVQICVLTFAASHIIFLVCA